MARRIRAREVLRLRSVNGLSQNAIARTAHVSKHSVQDVLEAARERGVSWEDVEGMSEEAAYALLFPGRGDAGPVHADPDWARVHRELARTGVTLKLLHAEYADGCAEAGAPSMSYDRFCKRYRQYTVSRNVVSRVGHKAGRNMEVDWSGPTMRLVDPATGEVRKVYLFVACLPFSRYSYVEPTLDMKQDTWLLCHVHAFSFLGGATPCIVPDNLRTGVTAHPRAGEPVLNAAYEELAAHYGSAVIPARVRRPRDKPSAEMDWQHLFGRFREGQPRLPELDRRHVAQRRVDPEVVVPVHVVRELGPELARRAERLAVDELGLQYPVGRLVDGVVVGAALGRQRPLNAEGLEHQVDLGVVELAAAVRVEDLDVRDGEGERRERRLDQPGVLPGPGGVADDLPVVEVDEQADVVPRGPDAHVGQVAAYMGARRPAAEAARDDVGHVGLVDRPGVHLEPLPAVCADQAVLPHDAADPAPADGDARPLERRLYLARAVPALAGGVGRDHGRRGGVRRGGPVGPRAHGVVRRPRDAEEPALR
ncbi:IS21 family transposase [Blautia wexlerae]|nr:IS21 family transposase [Blautia wexlerae]